MNGQKVAVVTGGARGIGKVICEALSDADYIVRTIDLLPCGDVVGDIADEATLRAFAARIIEENGAVDLLVNNACLSRGGLDRCSYDEFNYVLRVGVSAPFYLTQLLSPIFRPVASVVNICSTRHAMSQRDTESYSAAKGGIDALTHAMAITLSGKARVNAISPGWIDTTGSTFTGPDADQHPVRRVGVPMDIASAVLFLADDARSGFITGQNLTVDGGMSKLMIYHADEGWTYQA